MTLPVSGIKITQHKRMVPEYSIEALEKAIAQFYKNEKTLLEAASKERVKAKHWEKEIEKLRKENAENARFNKEHS